MQGIGTWAIVLATFAGPIFAVIVTRMMDERRLKQQRQQDVFQTLMLTRRAFLSREHVGALNRIELEFSADREVMTALRAYFDNLSDTAPEDAEAFEVFSSRRRRLFAELVQLIGSRMKFSVDRLDLIEGGYHPKGWLDDEQTGRANMVLLKELLSGQRALWTTPLPPAGRAVSPFPPPPNVTGGGGD